MVKEPSSPSMTTGDFKGVEDDNVSSEGRVVEDEEDVLFPDVFIAPKIVNCCCFCAG